jgi:hypothetical protein
MRPSQSGVYNQFLYSTALKGLMYKPRSGVCNKFPYNTALKGLMRPKNPWS